MRSRNNRRIVFFLRDTMAHVFSDFGFANLGNTCFLNAILQGILRCKPLQKHFLETSGHEFDIRKGTKKHRLVPAMKDIFEQAQKAKQGDCIVPRSFLQALWETVQECDDDWFRPRQQADSAECLQYILEGLHDALYRSVQITVRGTARTSDDTRQLKALESWKTFFTKEYSCIVENFYGQSAISLECQTCKTVSERYEPWLMLKIPIPGGDKVGSKVPTMQECLNKLFESESIPDYACDTCKSKQPAIKRESISKLPNILLLSFKRFTNTGAKIRGQINWNLNQLSLNPWLTFERCPFTGTRKHPTFTTFTVIEHQGSAHGGHYHMYGRGTNWNNYDDCSVHTSVADSKVITADSYILFLAPSKP